MRKLIKKVCAVVVANAILISGLNINYVSCVANANQDKIVQNEINVTASQKEEAKEQDNRVNNQLKSTKESKEKNKNPQVVKELKELNTANSTTYLLSNGDRRLEIYSEDIRYKENGKYVKYNPELKKVTDSEKEVIKKEIQEKDIKADYEYVNIAGDAKHYFPNKLEEENPVALMKGKHRILFSPINIEQINLQKKTVLESIDSTVLPLKLNKESVKNTSLVYNAGKQISYKYTSLNSGIKEEIILSEIPETNVFEFKLQLKDMKAEEYEEQKEIRFFDKKSGKLIAYISQPNIKDANNELVYDSIHYEMESLKKDEYILKVVVENEYLNSKDIKYPITIDPTVSWFNDSLQSASVTNFEYSKSFNLKHTSVIQIYNKAKYGQHIYAEDMCYIDTSGIDYNTGMAGSSSMFYGSDVKSAYLRITEKDNIYTIGKSGSGTFVSGNVEVRNPNSTWNPNTITWNNHPPVEDRVWSQFKCTGISNTVHNVDLKDWAQAVADRSIGNNGLALRCVEDGTGANFYTSSLQNLNYMRLAITYENPHIGEKDNYAYEKFDTPNGSGKIELSQGNFMYKQNDFSLPTPQLGLEISRTYNSRNTEQSNFGIGWTCEYDAHIKKDLRSTTYVDGSGAIYDMKNKSETSYICDENPDILLEEDNKVITRTISATDTKPSSTISFVAKYVLTDKNKTKRYFDEDGKLILIEESNGTYIYIKYHSTVGLIQSVYSDKGRSIDFEYSYSDGQYYISKTILEDGSSFNYTYTNKRLTRVVHKGNEGNEITYNYEYNANGQMSKLFDAVGNIYQLEYDGKSVSSAIYPDNSRIDVYTNYEPLKTRVYTKNANNMILHYEQYEFDESGKVLKCTNDVGNVTTYAYNGSLLTNTTEEVQYHELIDNIVKTITPTGKNGDKQLEEKKEYNEEGNIIKETDEEGNVTEYTYGDIQNPNYETKIKTTTATGKVIDEIAFEYDSEGNLVKETDYIEKTVTTYAYDSDGNEIENVEVLIDKNANFNNVSSADISKGLENSQDTATYNRDGNVTTANTVSGTMKLTEQNTYDALGRIKTTTDEKNVVTSYGYDEFGRNNNTIATIPGKGTETTTTVYDANGRIIEETDKSGRKMKYTYDKMGRVTSKTIIYGNEQRTTTTTYGYMDNFYIIVGNGTNKRIPTVYVVTEKNTNNEVVSSVYTDAYGQKVREESNGICKDYTYDRQGNVFTTYTRGVSGTNPIAPKLTVTVYDKYGRLTNTIENPIYRNGAFTVDATQSIVKTNKYNENGNLIEETDGKGNKTIYEYNEEGKLIKVKLSDGTEPANETFYAYDIQNKDALGNIITTKDTTTNALGNISESIYNGAGQLLSVEDKNTTNSIKTSYDYDNSGNKIKETFSDGSYIKYTYDKKNLLLLKYEYNSKNVWTKLSHYEYNEDDKLTVVQDYNVTNNTPKTYRYTKYEYDGLGRMVGYSEINGKSQPTEEEVNANKLVYKYDIEDKLIEIRYPNIVKDKLKGIKFEYNNYKWLVKIKGIISENGEERLQDIRNYEYYNDSKIKIIKDYRDFLNLSDGYVQKSYEYDIFDRVTTMTYVDSINLNKILEQYTYGYDKNSNITTENIINDYPTDENEKVNETRTYTYDNLNRMIASKKTDNLRQTEINTTYTYDKGGNCTKVDENGIITNNTYNGLNQLVQSEVIKNNVRDSYTVYTYDANGNQILEQTKDATSTITEIVQKEYDANNQLTKVTCRNGNTSGKIKYTQENTYNYDGKRISKNDNGAVTNYFYQGEVVLYTTDESGNVTSHNIIGPQNNIIATIRYENEGEHSYFYNKDIRTSVSNIIDESGQAIASYKYGDYGKTTKVGNLNFYNEICYTSGVYDELTGLYYFNSRYYNPDTATFITQDSYRGEADDYETWNLYAYCGGNPISYVDPSGHKKEKIYGVVLEVKTTKTDKEKTKFVKALYRISNKNKFKDKYKLFKIKVARQVLVAQSAWESGYGTSNLAVNNNNLFGFVGKKYDSIKDSIEAYAWQLNNGKQRGYKKARKYLKKNKKDAVGYIGKFAGTYCVSSSPESYTNTIMNMINYIKNRGVWR